MITDNRKDFVTCVDFSLFFCLYDLSVRNLNIICKGCIFKHLFYFAPCCHPFFQLSYFFIQTRFIKGPFPSPLKNLYVQLK